MWCCGEGRVLFGGRSLPLCQAKLRLGWSRFGLNIVGRSGCTTDAPSQVVRLSSVV